MITAKPFVSPLLVAASIILINVANPVIAVAVAFFSCGWISYSIVETLERRRRRRVIRANLKRLEDQTHGSYEELAGACAALEWVLREPEVNAREELEI